MKLEEKGLKPDGQTDQHQISPALIAGRTATPILPCPATPDTVSD